MSSESISQNKIDIVCRQTNYTEEEATLKLTEFNNDVMAVIKDYLQIEKKTVQKTKTINQQIYSELRGFMDTIYQQNRERNDKAI